jgi:hypothetical protein
MKTKQFTRKTFRPTRLWAPSLVILAAIWPAKVQTTFGSVVGLVTDSSGSAVPKAQVTLTNLGTSEQRCDQTTASGNYELVSLRPSQYRITIQAYSLRFVTQTSNCKPDCARCQEEITFGSQPNQEDEIGHTLD